MLADPQQLSLTSGGYLPRNEPQSGCKAKHPRGRVRFGGHQNLRHSPQETLSAGMNNDSTFQQKRPELIDRRGSAFHQPRSYTMDGLPV